MVRILLILLLALGVRAEAQIPQTTLQELQALAARAQVIFTGQVAAIDRNDAAGFVDIRFRIDRSLRGAPARGTYVLREWAGLWIANPGRYQVGERRLMLLTARSLAGFSAPVGDTEGAIPILPIGDVSSTLSADLHWVGSSAQRVITASGAAGGAAGGDQDWPGPIAPLAPGSQAQPVPLTTVLALLGAAAPATVLKGPLDAH